MVRRHTLFVRHRVDQPAGDSRRSRGSALIGSYRLPDRKLTAFLSVQQRKFTLAYKIDPGGFIYGRRSIRYGDDTS